MDRLLLSQAQRAFGANQFDVNIVVPHESHLVAIRGEGWATFIAKIAGKRNCFWSRNIRSQLQPIKPSSRNSKDQDGQNKQRPSPPSLALWRSDVIGLLCGGYLLAGGPIA